ncbi:hypothetical protein Goklo_005024 [Gossypium klotzschianum]|uniref:RNase H type-1 domain-containing protein n=1 Tax=Gossypium klotzschianum TaxID=34286 RepID=A0A7J8VQN0_9ROSI|nr:hypothetical protein [Gossypium klotzschianum]
MAQLHDSSRVTTNQWACPTRGWVKLNMDGAVSRNSSFASIGRVFRCADGQWLGGFSVQLGNVSIFKIEVRALLEGLLISWRIGYQQLEVECDNALLVELILAGGAVDSHLTEMCLIHHLLSRNWKVLVHHIPRSQNTVADHMAKWMAANSTEIHWFKEPSQSAISLIEGIMFLL